MGKSINTGGKRGTLAARAYERIRDMILCGDLPLGAPISRRQLAECLGMSALPITTALDRLKAEGLVESRPRSGTRVRIPAEQEILGHYIVREALESQVARLFAESATAAERADLMKRARRLDMMFASSPLLKLDRSKRLFEIHREHFLFHMSIAEIAGCHELTAALEKNQVLIFQWLYNSAAHFDTLPARWHENLAKVLCAGNPEEADKAMRQHVRFRRDIVAARIAVYHEAESKGAMRFRLRRSISGGR